MMKKIIRNLKNDYRGVSEAIHYSFKFKIPEVAILIYYIIMFPIGLVLYPFVKIWSKILLWKMTRHYQKNK